MLSVPLALMTNVIVLRELDENCVVPRGENAIWGHKARTLTVFETGGELLSGHAHEPAQQGAHSSIDYLPIPVLLRLIRRLSYDSDLTDVLLMDVFLSIGSRYFPRWTTWA